MIEKTPSTPQRPLQFDVVSVQSQEVYGRVAWQAKPSGKRGRSQTFSDAAIRFCLSIKCLARMGGHGKTAGRARGHTTMPRRLARGRDEASGRPGAATYHRRSLVEAKMHCFKRLGERVIARTFERHESVRGWGYGAGKSICATKPLQIHDKAIKSTRIAFPAPTFASGPRILRV
ncbi:hypothetical protein HNP55_003684 [Paucibacter oligotrophus]|uniref:Transposase DDE domain-containing protein n=1 Tax=Roseateles oligotrophus TaxID=1769250 RepID=A0A840LFZ6_9BURK|nr:hypothetical protein [Roseateles oligotrophus]